MKRASYSCCNFLCVVFAAAYLKSRRCRLSCLPFVRQFFSLWHTHAHTNTRARTHTHTHTHTHISRRGNFSWALFSLLASVLSFLLSLTYARTYAHVHARAHALTPYRVGSTNFSRGKIGHVHDNFADSEYVAGARERNVHEQFIFHFENGQGNQSFYSIHAKSQLKRVNHKLSQRAIDAIDSAFPQGL